jgi:cyclase
MRDEGDGMTRRRLLLAALAASRPAAAQSVAPPLLDRGFGRVTQIVEGVYATLADPGKGPQCASNGGIVAGRDAVLIVEGHMEPAGAALEIEAARMVSKAPVRGAIDTHFHLDHTFGNRAYAEQKISILAHEKVAGLMQERYVAVQGADKAPLLAPHEQKLARARDAVDKERKQADLEKFKWMYGVIDGTRIALPTESLRTTDLPKRIDLGGLSAVIEFCPGHTETDLLIQVPERNVVFAGDLLFYRSYPVSVDANMLAWRKALDRLSHYGSRIRFVPGHGPVCGQETVREQAALFDHLREHAGKMRRAGVTVEEAERRYVVPKPFESFRISSWGWTIGAAMQSLYS